MSERSPRSWWLPTVALVLCAPGLGRAQPPPGEAAEFEVPVSAEDDDPSDDPSSTTARVPDPGDAGSVPAPDTQRPARTFEQMLSGLDTTGTQDGFNRAVTAIPTDRALAFSIEKNADHERNAAKPEYRIKTIIIQLTQAELEARMAALLEDD